jgi:cobalt/nickel transport system permease protein
VVVSLFIRFLSSDSYYSLGSGSTFLFDTPINLEVRAIVFLNILLKSYLSILSLILLTSTTRFDNLLSALKRLKFPSLIIQIMTFMYRYMFIIIDELMRLKAAKESRTVFSSKWNNFKTSTNLIGVLFIRSFERAERIYLAMLARGFKGDVITTDSFKLTRRDAIFSLGLLCVIFIIRNLKI